MSLSSTTPDNPYQQERLWLMALSQARWGLKSKLCL